MSLKIIFRRFLGFREPGSTPDGPERSPGAPAPIGADAEWQGVVARLAGGLAHDLNNIILVVQGYAEMALDEPDAGPGVRALLADMKDATARASRLVSDLQVVGELGPFTPRPLDMSEVVRRRLPALVSATPAGIEIRSSLAEGLRPVLADEELVGRMLDAVCARAREALPEGGVITITTEPCTAGGGKAVILRVHDTGPAMSDEIRARLFQPYFPGPGGGTGLGLGMSVVYSAVKRLGGEISVHSGAGTAIAISIPPGIARDAPAHTRPVEPPSHLSAPAPRGATGVTILLAEDDEFLRDLAVKVLTREGYDVLSARDGQEAVDIFESAGQRIRLALLDDVMPRMGGRAALSKIQREAPGLPVILCSGYAWKFDGHVPQSTGYCETLQKPWQPRELLQKVREGLESRR